MVGFLAYSILAIIVISCIIIYYVLKWIFDYIGDKFLDDEVEPDHKLTIKDIDSWNEDELEEARKVLSKYSDPNNPTNKFLDIVFKKK